MNTVDNPGNFVDPQSVSPYPAIVRYGVILGLVALIYSVVAAMTGLMSFSNFTLIFLNMAISFALTIGLLVVAVRFHRNEELGGYIPFARAFIVAFGVGLLGSLISSTGSFLYFKFVDPGFFERALSEMQTMFEKMGMDEATIEKAMESSKDSMNATSIFTRGLLNSAIFNAIIGLIIAAIMKKNQPEVV